jgi:hydroxysqualene dehydroxylase
MKGRVHVVGAGLAGLACATALAATGRQVTLYEAAGQAGGRCRSMMDARLDREIDNGNHLIVGANPHVFRYLDRIGGRDRMVCLSPTQIGFRDLRSGQQWLLRPGSNPLWLLDPQRRVAGVSILQHLAALRLAFAGRGVTVDRLLSMDSPGGERLWHPLTVSMLNTQPDEAEAAQLWPVLRRTLLSGEAACRPWLPRRGLSDALITPAINFLIRHQATIRLQTRLRSLGTGQGRIDLLHFEGGHAIALREDEHVVLALPPDRTKALLPDLIVPTEDRPILNAHFRLPGPGRLPEGLPFLGLIGGTAEWVFLRGDIASVTVSAAERLIDQPSPVLAERLWLDIASLLSQPALPLPPWRIIKERRAGLAATAENRQRRPGTRTQWRNLMLAGDWTWTGLPSTMEGAVQSGHTAAALIGKVSG